MDRWATFDCYGTLVDWNAGIGAALGDPSLLERYHEVEPLVQAENPGRRYRDVLRETARRVGVDADPAASLPDWPVLRRRPRRARGGARARVAARDPHELRPRSDRGVDRVDRRPVRPRDRRVRDRLVQAGARPLARVRGRDRTPAGRARRPEPLPRRRAGDGARHPDDLDQSPRRDPRPAVAVARAPDARRSRRRARPACAGRRSRIYSITSSRIPRSGGASLPSS